MVAARRIAQIVTMLVGLYVQYKASGFSAPVSVMTAEHGLACHVPVEIQSIRNSLYVPIVELKV